MKSGGWEQARIMRGEYNLSILHIDETVIMKSIILHN